MITHLFNKAIIIKRLKTLEGQKRHMVSTGTIDAHIQRTDEHTDSPTGDVYAQTHKAWVDISADVNDGDDVIDPDGVRYSVIAVIEKEPGIAMNEHKELILRRYSS